MNCFTKLYNGIKIILHKTEYVILILQKKRKDSVMKTDTSVEQRDRKVEVLAPKHCSIRPRPRPKTARTNR